MHSPHLCAQGAFLKPHSRYTIPPWIRNKLTKTRPVATLTRYSYRMHWWIVHSWNVQPINAVDRIIQVTHKTGKNIIFIKITHTSWKIMQQTWQLVGLILDSTYISIELANEAWKITVLEVLRKQSGGEFVRIPNNEAISTQTPRYNWISRWVFNHIKCFRQKWRWTHFM